MVSIDIDTGDAVRIAGREATELNEETVNALKALKNLKHTDASSDGCSSCGDGSRFGVPLNWPVKLKYAPVTDAVYNNADLLIAADCACFLYSKFHRDFINGSVVLAICPAPGETDYYDKLSKILEKNDFRSLTVVKTDAECCSSLDAELKKAVISSGRIIPCKTVTISAAGNII